MSTVRNAPTWQAKKLSPERIAGTECGMPDDLLYMTAAEATQRIRRRDLSPVTYVRAVLAAIEASQPLINAFVTTCPAEALEAAQAAEDAAKRGENLGPLHGIPVSVKDLVAVDGLHNKQGSLLFADNVADHDAPAVARLKAAGAIVVGKTTTPEFGHKGLTDCPLTGITRNPWNLDHTPGGSSGGASAAVAAGLAPLAVGTDGAGSIRGPAASTGIVGLKPTRGRVPHEAKGEPFGNQSYSGPMTRTVSDAALMLDVMAGPHVVDPWSLAEGIPPPLAALDGNDLSGITIGYAEKMANPQIDPEVAANTKAALGVFEDLGARVEPVPDGFDWAEPAGRVLYQSGFHVMVQAMSDDQRAKLTPSLVTFATWGGKFSLADRAAAEAARGALYHRVQGLFGRFDFLMSPTAACPPLKADFDATSDVVINGKPCGITRQSWTAYQYPFNLTGHPALSVPSGFTQARLPTALQIVGPWWSDHQVLRLGALLEHARPWAHLRPPAKNRGR
jgi:aspartyl-tRNA(Asn)/glutamyl-tRNA(Gln) amidotransferase subunit A